jgi:hypothetical protein
LCQTRGKTACPEFQHARSAIATMLKRGMFSTSSTGRKIRRRYPSTSEASGPEAASAGGHLRSGYTPAVAQVAAVASPSTAPTKIAVSNLDRAHMWITPRFR